MIVRSASKAPEDVRQIPLRIKDYNLSLINLPEDASGQPSLPRVKERARGAINKIARLTLYYGGSTGL